MVECKSCLIHIWDAVVVHEVGSRPVHRAREGDGVTILLLAGSLKVLLADGSLRLVVALDALLLEGATLTALVHVGDCHWGLH